MDFNLDVGVLRFAVLEVLIVLISITVHEWGHAKMADRLGDDTPRSQGRLTLNPLAHLDLVGTIILPLISALGLFGHLGVIGWGKPVSTNPRNFKNRNTDEALVTLAGPAMNLVLGLIATIFAALVHRSLPSLIPLLMHILEVNILLAVFNLLPIPPLDGSKFLMYWFGMSEESYLRFSQWGGLLLLGLLFIPRVQALLQLVIALATQPFLFIYSLLAH
jgi:Zn-dependent protease